METSTKQKAPAGEPKPRGRPQKYLIIEQLAIQLETIPITLLEATPWTDNNGGNNDNNIEDLKEYKTAMSITSQSAKCTS